MVEQDEVTRAMVEKNQRCGGVFEHLLGRKVETAEDVLEARSKMSEFCRENWKRRKAGPAVNLLRFSWRTFLDILPACRWDPNLAMKKVAGLPEAAKKSFASYLNHHPDLQRAIDEKKRECFGVENGVVTPTDIEESERVRQLVMRGLEDKAVHGESEAVQVRALEVLGKAVGLFSDKVEGGSVFFGQVNVDQEAVARARSFLTAKPEEVKTVPSEGTV
jgi:hypothetical protein